MKSRRLAAAVAAAALLAAPAARAGGFDELPDQGAQALGRGATFTAKADDPTALYYNVAGLAKQRGTRLLVSGNLQFDRFQFSRAGTYPDDPADPATPWGGKAFPVAEDKNASALLPMMMVTTDLGLFDRLTFGAGVWGPATNGKTFPLGVGGQPSPARYDYVQSSALVVYPTLGAGYRITDAIDVGVAGHVVVANLDELSLTYVDPGGGACKTVEDFRCDTQGTLKANGTGFAASVGVLARPFAALEVGAQVKTPWTVHAAGTAAGKLGSGTALPPEAANLDLSFPWILRTGVRYIGHDADGKVERYDVELDATYEAWHSAQSPGPIARTIDPTTNQPTSVPIVHNYNDTVSLRGGGAYNVDVGEDVLTLRAGAFYDSASTDSAYTRVDVNTLAKVAGTLGLGYRHGALGVDLAYAGVASLGRDVTDGDVRPSNAVKGGQSIDGAGKPLPAVNNGSYRAFTHVVSIGIQVRFDMLFGKGAGPGEPKPTETVAAAAPPPPPPAEPAAPAPSTAPAVATAPPEREPEPVDPAPSPPPKKTKSKSKKRIAGAKASAKASP